MGCGQRRKYLMLEFSARRFLAKKGGGPYHRGDPYTPLARVELIVCSDTNAPVARATASVESADTTYCVQKQQEDQQHIQHRQLHLRLHATSILTRFEASWMPNN